MGFFNKRPDSKTIGEKLGNLTVMLFGNKNIDDFITQMKFDKAQAERFRFCLLFFNVSYATWCVNLLGHPQYRTILDSMLDRVMGAAEEDQRHLRVGDYILDKVEMKIFDSMANENTKTTFYSLFSSLYEDRMRQYTNAISQQMDLVLKSKERKNFFALDPIAKLFVKNFTGDNFENHMELLFCLSTFLPPYQQVIMEGINEIMKGNL